MTDDRSIGQKKIQNTLAKLKDLAIADLELRGYEVRGKTPAQIRQILKRRPMRQQSNVKGSL